MLSRLKKFLLYLWLNDDGFFQLGSGRVFGNPTGGNEATNPTPQFFGTQQDLSLDIDQKLEELRGVGQFPDDVGPTDRKISGKIGFGKIENLVINNLFLGDVQTTGEDVTQPLETHTVPASPGPYTITIAPPETGTFVKDLGVIYGSFGGIGGVFQKVTSVTAKGQYSVASGTYTFYSGDAGAAIQISYVYSLTTGTTQQMNQQVLGWGPIWELWIALTYQVDVNGNPVNGMYFPAVRPGKLSAPLKRAGYMIQTLDFEAYASSSGLVGEWFQGPVSAGIN
jgi:hypothetical protein